jgi:hypothetical protein
MRAPPTVGYFEWLKLASVRDASDNHVFAEFLLDWMPVLDCPGGRARDGGADPAAASCRRLPGSGR